MKSLKWLLVVALALVLIQPSLAFAKKRRKPAPRPRPVAQPRANPQPRGGGGGRGRNNFAGNSKSYQPTGPSTNFQGLAPIRSPADPDDAYANGPPSDAGPLKGSSDSDSSGSDGNPLNGDADNGAADSTDGGQSGTPSAATEKLAKSKLAVAQQLLDRNPESALDRLNDIIKSYPRTAAAQTAKQLLKQRSTPAPETDAPATATPTTPPSAATANSKPNS